MTKYAEISKQVGWQKTSVLYPDLTEVEMLRRKAKEGNEHAFAQLFRYTRYLPGPKSGNQHAVMDDLIKAFKETKPIFEAIEV